MITRAAADYTLLECFIVAPTTDAPNLACARLRHLQLPDACHEGQGVVILGKGPIWLHAALAERVWQQGVPWVAVYNKKSDASVVVAARPAADRQVGESIRVAELQRREGLGAAVAILGGPHCGKSTLVAGLHQVLMNVPEAFVLRAHPDGEGQDSNESDADYVREHRVKREWSLQLVELFLKQIENARRTSEFVVVDTGGKPDEKTQALAAACGQALIVWRRTADKVVRDWQTEPVLQGVVAGLDRTKRGLGPAFEPLVDALLRRLHVPASGPLRRGPQ